MGGQKVGGSWQWTDASPWAFTSWACCCGACMPDNAGGNQVRLSILVPQIDPLVPQPVFTITEKASTRAFSWLKAPTSTFTFKTLLRHYAKQALTPRSLNVNLGP